MSLGGLNVHNKYESVGIFNKLHRRLGCEGVFDNGVLVQARLGGGADSLILGLSGRRKSLGLVKVYLGVDAASLLRDSLFEGF